MNEQSPGQKSFLRILRKNSTTALPKSHRWGPIRSNV